MLSGSRMLSAKGGEAVLDAINPGDPLNLAVGVGGKLVLGGVKAAGTTWRQLGKKAGLSDSETSELLEAAAKKFSKEGVSALEDLASMRRSLGMAPNQGVLARLDVNGSVFYGISAHGQDVTMYVNAISRTHAEADAFQQALNAGARSGRVILYVDKPLCMPCGRNGGVGSMGRAIGADEVIVVTPRGVDFIRP